MDEQMQMVIGDLNIAQGQRGKAIETPEISRKDYTTQVKFEFLKRMKRWEMYYAMIKEAGKVKLLEGTFLEKQVEEALEKGKLVGAEAVRECEVEKRPEERGDDVMDTLDPAGRHSVVAVDAADVT